MIPESEWVWCGYAGHFTGSRDCRFHLCTRVGDHRVSTVGDYHPGASAEAVEIGLGRTYETYVFTVEGHGEHGEGAITSLSEVEAEGYTDSTAADAGHMAMCRKYASTGAA